MFVYNIITVVFISLQVTASPSIIIIGAGASGIAAASKLYENNFKNITILEAENRIGGRINTVYFGEGFIDLGAEWCHGEKNNIVYSLAKDFNILKHTEFTSSIHLSSKRQLDEDFSAEMIDLVSSIIMSDNVGDSKNKHFVNLSIGEYALEQFNLSINKKYGNDSKSLENAKLFENVLRNYILSLEGSLNWFEPSLISDYEDCEGDHNLNWNGFGYKTILEILMKTFPNPSKQVPLNEHILLNKEVTKISWNEDVTVQCSDETTYTADHIIFTPSIGVLKENHLDIFSPILPKQKHEAINQIGFGAVIKVPVYFKTQWWNPHNFTGFNLVWTDEDKAASVADFSDGPVRNGQRWVTAAGSIIPGERNPNVLYIWFVGDMVPEIEILPNPTLMKGIVFILNKFFGAQFYKIPAPDNFLRTSWYSNPHFRGTYSYQTKSTTKGANSAEVQLSKPLLNKHKEPIVLFAGEATNPIHYSTVHGAIETGFREADRIINFYKH